MFLIAILLFVPPVIDWANGVAKSGSSCQIAMVMDGDTVKMTCPETGIESGRIIGFDAPEKNARCMSEYLKAVRATWSLRLMLWRADTIHISANNIDRYERMLIDLKLDGVNVAPVMIETGYARAYNGGRRGSWCE